MIPVSSLPWYILSLRSWTRSRFNRMEFPSCGPRGNNVQQSLMTLWPVTRLLCCHFYTIGRDRFQDIRACIYAIFAACDPVVYSFVMNRNDYATIFHFFLFIFFFFFLMKKYESLRRDNFAVLKNIIHCIYYIGYILINWPQVY